MAGMAWFSASEAAGWNRPASWARHRAPASAAMKTSAGLLAPSAFMRAISSSGLPSMRLTSMPVFCANRS
ncbi:hypothetical protein D3C80_1653000 [compost metagenome]